MVLESTFSIDGLVIEETHVKLLLDMVETLVTTDDWIESKKNRVKYQKTPCDLIKIQSNSL
mgnify:CR=1 FL=1